MFKYLIYYQLLISALVLNFAVKRHGKKVLTAIKSSTSKDRSLNVPSYLAIFFATVMMWGVAVGQFNLFFSFSGIPTEMFLKLWYHVISSEYFFSVDSLFLEMKILRNRFLYANVQYVHLLVLHFRQSSRSFATGCFSIWIIV